MTDLLLNVVDGVEDWPVLLSVGFVVRMGPSDCEIEEPPKTAVVVPTTAQVARGYLRNWALGSALHDWARVILGVNAIDLGALEEEPSGEVLLEALWIASEDGTVSDDVLEVIRGLAR